MSENTGVVVGPHSNTEGTEVYLAVQIPESMDINAARERLAGLSWADSNVRRKAGRPRRTLLVQPYKPTARRSDLDLRAESIATHLLGLEGFDGTVTVSYEKS